MNTVRVPSAHTSDRAAVLVDIPPPCSQGARGGKRNVPLGPPMAPCSLVCGEWETCAADSGEDVDGGDNRGARADACT